MESLEQTLRDLQHCRAELEQTAREVARLRGSLRAAVKRVQWMEKSLSAYFNSTKNPFKLVWNRVSQPGGMRRNRKAIEGELRSLQEDLKAAAEAVQIGKKMSGVAVDSASVEPANPAAGAKHHVVITGTGRAGTTFLIELLTALGMHTGFDRFEGFVDKDSHAGMEWDIRAADAPYVVKNPRLCDYLGAVMEEGRVVVDHAFVPMREIRDAAASRERVNALAEASGRLRPGQKAPGGYMDANGRREQEIVLMEKLCGLMVTLARHNVPTTLLSFPRLVEDARYLHEKLEPVLQGMSFQMFEETFQKVSHPELISRAL